MPRPACRRERSIDVVEALELAGTDLAQVEVPNRVFGITERVNVLALRPRLDIALYHSGGKHLLVLVDPNRERDRLCFDQTEFAPIKLVLDASGGLEGDVLVLDALAVDRLVPASDGFAVERVVARLARAAAAPADASERCLRVIRAAPRVSDPDADGHGGTGWRLFDP